MTSIALTIRNAATQTDISETTIRTAINKQELPAHRVGRSIRILRRDLEEWLSNLPRVGAEDE